MFWSGGFSFFKLFLRFLQKIGFPQNFRKLLVAPVSLRKRMEELIQREIKHSKEGKVAKIKAKMKQLKDSDKVKIPPK